MTVDFAYNLMKYACNKNQQGYLSPADFNLIINQAQNSFLNYLLGDFQQYQYGHPVAKVQLGMNETVRQRLTAFINPLSSITIDSTGFSQYPLDYQQSDALYTTSMQRIKYVQQDRLYSYLSSVIDPIASNPIYLIESGGFRFYPNTLGSALLSYIKTPTTIVWGYTNDVNGRPVYNKSTSVDPAWYDLDFFEVIVRALSLVGVNLQVPMLEQYANQIKIQGQ
jgi:hypothetical protein